MCLITVSKQTILWCGALCLLASCKPESHNTEAQSGKPATTLSVEDDPFAEPGSPPTKQHRADPFSEPPAPPETPAQKRTSELLQKTMMAEIDWPEQPLGERIALIRQEAARIGVTVEESRMVRQTTWTYPALKYRNISLDVALKYTADSTRLLYRVTDRGALRFFLNDDVDR